MLAAAPAATGGLLSQVCSAAFGGPVWCDNTYSCMNCRRPGRTVLRPAAAAGDARGTRFSSGGESEAELHSLMMRLREDDVEYFDLKVRHASGQAGSAGLLGRLRQRGERRALLLWPTTHASCGCCPHRLPCRRCASSAAWAGATTRTTCAPSCCAKCARSWACPCLGPTAWRPAACACHRCGGRLGEWCVVWCRAGVLQCLAVAVSCCCCCFADCRRACAARMPAGRCGDCAFTPAAAGHDPR